MKKIFTLFFAILCFTNASAVDFKVNGIFYSYDSEKKMPLWWQATILIRAISPFQNP